MLSSSEIDKQMSFSGALELSKRRTLTTYS